MQSFSLSNNERRALAKYHREFQAAIAVIANRSLGFAVTQPEGIGKYEGGVRVNFLEIVIYSDAVAEDWKRSGKIIPEEVAVANAIRTIADDFKVRGAMVFEPYRDMTKSLHGNPLNAALFDCVAK